MKWPTVALGNIATMKYGKLPPQNASFDSLYPIFTGYRIAGFSSEYLYEEPQVIVVARGVGGTGDVKISPPKCWITNLSIVLSVDPERVLKEFLAYRLQQEPLREVLNTGAAQAQITIENLQRYKISLPNIAAQRSIVVLISTYDSLIENNRRRIGLLEESARLLYREWFVRLRFPGHERTKMVDGVPKGWHKVPLSSIISVAHGYAFAGEHFSDDETSRVLMTPGNFKIGGGIKIDKLKYYREEGPLDSSYVLSPMDLTVTMTDLSKTSDTLGYPALVPNLSGVSFLHNQRVGKVLPVGDFFPRYFLYCLLCEPNYRHHVVGAATGTSVKHTAPSRITSYARYLPKETDLLAAFEEVAQPIFQQMNVLLEFSRRLQSARDLLLPRLMSGEILV